MQDGSDQARYRVVRCLRVSKDMEGKPCPRLKLLGSWVHGMAAVFSLIEEDVIKDSQTTIEGIFEAIEEARIACEAEGRQLPEHLWIQLDNAPGENKNQWVCKAIAALVSMRVFRSATVAFLRVAHTHEDLDAVWGVNATILGGQLRWDSPEQIAQHTSKVVDSLLGSSANTHVRRMDFVRDWKSWTDSLGISGVPGITGKGSPHYYRFSLREDRSLENVFPLHYPRWVMSDPDVRRGGRGWSGRARGGGFM